MLGEGNIKVQPNFSDPDEFQRFYIHLSLGIKSSTALLGEY